MIAILIDEAIEHSLALFGAATNTAGDYDTVEYELTAGVVHHDVPLARRMSIQHLSGMLKVISVGVVVRRPLSARPLGRCEQKGCWV